MQSSCSPATHPHQPPQTTSKQLARTQHRCNRKPTCDIGWPLRERILAHNHGFGAPGSAVQIELSSEVSHPAAVVHHAGGEMRHIIGVASGGSIVYVVELGVDGEAMLQLF